MTSTITPAAAPQIELDTTMSAIPVETVAAAPNPASNDFPKEAAGATVSPSETAPDNTSESDATKAGLDESQSSEDNNGQTGLEKIEIQEEGESAGTTVSGKPPPPEEGLRAWLTAFSTFAAQGFAIGYASAWGVYNRTLLTGGDFPGANAFQLAFCGTIALGTLTVTGIFTGALSDRLPTQLMALGGAVTMAAALLAGSFATQIWMLFCSQALYGIGASFALMPATAVLPTWFTKRRSLAMGLATSGTGVGGAVMSVVSQACISAGGWRLGLRVLAAMAFGIVGLASIFIKRRVPNKGPPGKFRPINFSYFRNATFSLLFGVVFTTIFAFFTPSMFIPLMLFDGGYGNATGAAVSAAFSAMLAVGRILGGLITDYVGELNMLYIGCTIPGTMALLWMINPTNLVVVVVTSMIWAFFGGAPLVATPVLASKEFGIVGLGSVLGMLYIAFGPGQLFGPSISGMIVDNNTYYNSQGQRVGADYRPLLGFSAAMWLVASFIGLALRWTKVKWKLKVKI